MTNKKQATKRIHLISDFSRNWRRRRPTGALWWNNQRTNTLDEAHQTTKSSQPTRRVSSALIGREREREIWVVVDFKRGHRWNERKEREPVAWWQPGSSSSFGPKVEKKKSPGKALRWVFGERENFVGRSRWRKREKRGPGPSFPTVTLASKLQRLQSEAASRWY